MVNLVCNIHWYYTIYIDTLHVVTIEFQLVKSSEKLQPKQGCLQYSQHVFLSLSHTQSVGVPVMPENVLNHSWIFRLLDDVTFWSSDVLENVKYHCNFRDLVFLVESMK